MHCSAGVEEVVVDCGSKRGLYCIVGVEVIVYCIMEVVYCWKEKGDVLYCGGRGGCIISWGLWE